MSVRRCPAALVSAPASGQGKTSVTAALARWHASQGRRVRVFKTGPDFLDPLVLSQAAGTPVYQLDMWMGGEADVRRRLLEAAAGADLILVEGAMGLFDGVPSSADLAQQLGLPVLAVIDASPMAQTFGALALGLSTYRTGWAIYGVAANRIGGAYHARLLKESLPPGLVWLGALPRDDRFALPERHLGLVLAGELADLNTRLDGLARLWAKHAVTALPPLVAFEAPRVERMGPLLQDKRIAIAYDDAFCFVYPANLDVLRQAGAQLCFFSPVAGDALPVCDAVWLPGGYPELHLTALSRRHDLHAALRAHRNAGKPILAECGGLLFLLDSLTDREGHVASMAGLLPGHAAIRPRLVALGLQGANLPEGRLRGHSFHYAQASIEAPPLVHACNPNQGPSKEAIYRDRRLTASFVHFYFSSNPLAAVQLFLA